MINDPDINNKFGSNPNSSKKDNTKSPEFNAVCLCNKINEDTLFEKNQCKLCGRVRLEGSIKVKKGEKTSDVLTNNFMNNNKLNQQSNMNNVNNQIVTTNPPIKKVDSKIIDYTKYNKNN